MKTKKIVFMGTPDFATASLKALYENKYEIVAVVTAPDKPAGRGQNLIKSSVKIYAEEKNLKILQPANLKSPEFLAELTNLKPDLIIVAAFRMLPEQIWKLPPLGTVNLHASLLPDYRGAAPINYVIINGETKTGVTTFFIEKDIDTGKIIKMKPVDILPRYNAGILHDILMNEGASLILETVADIFKGNVNAISQNKILGQNIPKLAPKIFKENCKINWENSVEQIHNLIRGLSPYPAAWTNLKTENGKTAVFKIYSSKIGENNTTNKPGEIFTDNKTFVKISTQNAYLYIEEIQAEGKKRMDIKSFLNGFKFNNMQFI